MMDIKVNPNELIKANSRYLRGTLKESIADQATGALSAEDAQISKFHGCYEQDDRDQRLQRQRQFLEPYYSFMLRARLPGGVCTTRQWLAIDAVGRELGNGTIRLTTRQTFQYHGILKKNLKPLIQRINQAMIDSIGGCGDVNRNVLCNPNPEHSSLHGEVFQWARRISEQLLPKSRAYHEIWLDGEAVAGGESEPLYGEVYLPRKFKTAVAIPPHNDVDVYTNDLGFVAIAEGGRLLGFNVLAGGGMGVTHDDPTTFPRLADELGFIPPEHTLAVAEAVVGVQRDFGDRVSRRHARLKYTIERLGLEAFRTKVEERSGVRFAPQRPVRFTSQGDRYGWVEDAEGRWHLTLYIENGRVADTPSSSLLSGLREIAWVHGGDFRITPNQNLIVAAVAEEQKATIEALARRHGLLAEQRTPTRLASIACVALPTCPQAMAEAERYFPQLLRKIENMAVMQGIDRQAIVMRMTGCPNGCARPYVAEIGLVGKGPGRYNLLLGGDGRGLRLNRLYRKNLDERELLDTLEEQFRLYAAERKPKERFGDFVIRRGLVRTVSNPAEEYHESD
ncbi:MAG: assimilatory sulfite reductase (NADPH) hemoprotein subunit [Candidatus Thiodiazotropha sp. (ex Ctena orbiculata)]|nr:assimilatory sulfite reductase (NADPH) hemoprotein subunit [Candidatus Thiodiazotropha taylori]MBT2995531.1 assimilatory sulfite reductase (NADPH) hemoprotein subunit [Candidatus Thiodiazotropha taylori]MBT2999515.1 assimilatory sulfite reductase (NADPH) hemoprotein subunit [Candidatus Thiodiazotropha taylori]MBV2106608.1 assimilatory sulfite reductase (NADPH) hemoprotein subunit [Candidatus Thiodiazotropha taylori]MBV2110203.1 assimilatory sulfite reductase (NADPH) hemoprotein subunit [Cand